VIILDFLQKHRRGVCDLELLTNLEKNIDQGAFKIKFKVRSKSNSSAFKIKFKCVQNKSSAFKIKFKCVQNQIQVRSKSNSSAFKIFRCSKIKNQKLKIIEK
jgi:hypothetical protein